MKPDQACPEGSEFERRSRALLDDSTERLPAAVRSRLTQARYAALAARGARQQPALARRWLPAGALAAAALALLLAGVPGGKKPLDTPAVNAGLEDIELLTDSEAVPLNGDKDVDYDFYEWAADEATGPASLSVGS